MRKRTSRGTCRWSWTALGRPAWGVPRGAGAPAAVIGGGGDRPAVVGDGEWVGEHRWRARKLAAGRLGARKGVGGGSAGDRRAAALMAATGGSGHRGELGLALGAGRGVEGEGGGPFAKQREGGEPGEGASGLGNWCTALLGSFVAVARRRQSSACVQGDGAAWRGREASRRSQGRGTGRARRVAGGLNSTATSARQKTGEGRENRERIRGLIQIQIFLINSF